MAREFSIDVLEEMLEKFRVVTKERREEEELQQRQLAEKQEKINAFLELMKADGINPEELFAMDSAMPRSAKSASRVRQNIVLLISMAKKNWTGQGRTPKPIARALAAGKSLDDFLI